MLSPSAARSDPGAVTDGLSTAAVANPSSCSAFRTAFQHQLPCHAPCTSMIVGLSRIGRIMSDRADLGQEHTDLARDLEVFARGHHEGAYSRSRDTDLGVSGGRFVGGHVDREAGGGAHRLCMLSYPTGEHADVDGFERGAHR